MEELQEVASEVSKAAPHIVYIPKNQKDMNKTYHTGTLGKEVYEAPSVIPFCIETRVNVLVGFSLEGDIDDPETGSSFDDNEYSRRTWFGNND